MSKISSSINKQLKNTVIWRSYSTALGNLFRTSKSPIKHPNFPTPNAPVLGFSKTLSLKHSNSFSYTRLLLNLSFSSSHGGVTISSPHINNRHISSSDVNVGAPNIKKEHLLISIPVRAYFMFNRIDLKGLMADNQANLIPQTSGMTNYALLKFGDCDSSPPQPKPSGSAHSYMVVFPYGSTVMFNVLDGEVDRYLKIVEKHASGVLPEMRKDGMSFRKNCIKYEVKENSNLPTWMQGGLGYVMLQHLDNDGILVISFVLGQSIALDYYVRKLDGVIAAFTELYSERNKMRSYVMRKRRMCRLVGRANSTLAEIMVRLGLFQRLEIASVDNPNYSQMWKYLRDQFGMEQKFVGLDFYLKLMEVFMQFVTTETTRGVLSGGAGFFRICSFPQIQHLLSKFAPVH